MLKAIENGTWPNFKYFNENFLWYKKDPNYRNIVLKMLEHFKKLSCNMCLKMHFLHSHIDYKYPENLGHALQGRA